MLGISKGLIDEVFESGKDAIAKLIDGTELPIKRFDALKQVASVRQVRSKVLICTPNVDNVTQYTVRNEDKGSTYRVDLHSDHITCQCDDYKNLSGLLGQKVACKHVYRTLSYIGMNNLQDYIKRQQTINDVAANRIKPENDFPKTDSPSVVQYEAEYSHY